MAKYFFNPETLEYAKVELSNKERFIGVMKFASLVILLFTMIFIVSDDVVQSPKLNNLKADRQRLAYEIELLNRDLVHYDQILSRIELNDDQLYRVYFEVDPIPPTKREAGVGGSQRYSELNNKPFSNLLITTYMNQIIR